MEAKSNYLSSQNGRIKNNMFTWISSLSLSESFSSPVSSPEELSSIEMISVSDSLVSYKMLALKVEDILSK